jgi:hypothetical protein
VGIRRKHKRSIVQVYSSIYYQKKIKGIVWPAWKLIEEKGVAEGIPYPTYLNYRNEQTARLWEMESEDVKAEVLEAQQKECEEISEVEITNNPNNLTEEERIAKNTKLQR